jgi:hypothetical protein
MFLEGEEVVLNEHAKTGLPNRIGEICFIVDNLYNSQSYDYKVMFEDGETTRVRECEISKLTEEQKQLMTYIKKDNYVTYTPTNETVKIMKSDFIHGQIEIMFEDGGVIVVGIESVRQKDFKFKIGDKVIIKKTESEKMIGVIVQQPARRGDKKVYSVAFGLVIYSLFEEDLEIVDNSNEPTKAGYFAELGFEIGKLVDDKQKAYGDSVTKCYEIMKVLLQDYKNHDNTYTIPESIIPIMLLEVRKIDKMNRRFSNPDGDLMNENPFQDDVGYSMLGVRLMNQIK